MALATQFSNFRHNLKCLVFWPWYNHHCMKKFNGNDERGQTTNVAISFHAKAHGEVQLPFSASPFAYRPVRIQSVGPWAHERCHFLVGFGRNWADSFSAGRLLFGQQGLGAVSDSFEFINQGVVIGTITLTIGRTRKNVRLAKRSWTRSSKFSRIVPGPYSAAFRIPALRSRLSIFMVCKRRLEIGELEFLASRNLSMRSAA